MVLLGLLFAAPEADRGEALQKRGALLFRMMIRQRERAVALQDLDPGRILHSIRDDDNQVADDGHPADVVRFDHRPAKFHRLAALDGAREVGGQFVEGSLFAAGGKVVARAGPWTVTLDTLHQDEAVYTRMRAPFVNAADGLRFAVFRTHVFSHLARSLGFQERS